jgi:hypothetical protein
LHHTITADDAGAELQALAREENPTEALKAWEEHDLMEVVNPVLAKKKPDYDAIHELSKVRDDLMMAGLRPRLATPMMLAILGRLKDREQTHLLGKLGFRSAEIDAIEGFAENAEAVGKELAGKKLNAAIDAYKFLEKVPVEKLAYLLAESRNSTAISKIRAYLNKWRPLRTSIPLVREELSRIGMPAGQKFDAVVEQMFAMQLNGKGKTPEERERILRRLSGIKEPPKPKESKSKDKKGKVGEKVHAHAAASKGDARAAAKAAAKPAAAKAAGKSASAKAKKK